MDKLTRITKTDQRRALEDQAHELLKAEMVAALRSHPNALVITSSLGGGKLTALEVTSREYEERNCDDANLCALLIIGDLAKERSVLGLRASDWIVARAEHWANYNCVELGKQWAAEAEETAGAL